MDVQMDRKKVTFFIKFNDRGQFMKNRCHESIATDVAEKIKKCKSLHPREPSSIMHIPQKDR